MKATLYLIPVMLGEMNYSRVLPDDNRKVILSLKHFIVENVRSARRFLKKAAPEIVIDALHFIELNNHTSPEAIPSLLAPMGAGESVGLMSEAGCPAVADPGAEVIAIAHRKGYRVTPLVGPSSILMALMASGFNGQRFSFQGYLPVEAAKRVERIKALEARMVAEDETQIFMETPYRNHKLLDDLIRTCKPTTRLCVAAGITCGDEFIKTRPVKEWAGKFPDLNKKPAIFLIGKFKTMNNEQNVRNCFPTESDTLFDF